jgi:multiple sugar transport system permease protein
MPSARREVGLGMSAATTATSKPNLRQRSGLGHRGGLAGYLFVAPSLFFIVAFVILPIIAALYYSFTDYDLMSAPHAAGWKNYLRLPDDARYSKAVFNSLYFAVGTVPAGVLTSLLLATLINRSVRGIYAFRAMFYLPVVSSFVAVSLIWLWMYEPQFGLLNEILEGIGLPRLKWMRSPGTAMLSIIILSVWKNMGLNMVIYLAGMQGIPPHLYEAADIDGAGRVSKFFRVTMPLLAPTTFFVVIVYFIGALQMFTQVWVMTLNPDSDAGGPVDSTVTVVVLIYLNAFAYLKMGYSAAMSFVLFLIIAVITIINARLLRYDLGY